MKTKAEGYIDSARVALLLGLTVGLGMVVHEGFFFVAGAIAIGALAVATAHVMQEHTDCARLKHQHR